MVSILLLAADELGHGIGFGFAQRVGLSLAARFGHGFGKVGEEHGEPEPESDLELKADARPSHDHVPHQKRVVTAAPTSTTNMTGFLMSVAGFSFYEGLLGGPFHDFRIEQAGARAPASWEEG